MALLPLLLQSIFWFVGYLLSLLSFLVFRGAALLVVALVHLLQLPSQISTGFLDSVGDFLRSLLECALGLAKDVAANAASLLLEALRDAAAGSVRLTSEAAAELLEKTRGRLAELSEALPQLVESAADMVAQVVDGVWSGCKDALGYVMDNI